MSACILQPILGHNSEYDTELFRDMVWVCIVIILQNETNTAHLWTFEALSEYIYAS